MEKHRSSKDRMSEPEVVYITDKLLNCAQAQFASGNRNEDLVEGDGREIGPKTKIGFAQPSTCLTSAQLWQPTVRVFRSNILRNGSIVIHKA